MIFFVVSAITHLPPKLIRSSYKFYQKNRKRLSKIWKQQYTSILLKQQCDPLITSYVQLIFFLTVSTLIKSITRSLCIINSYVFFQHKGVFVGL